MPIFVKDQLDPLRHAGNIGDDPLDPQKVFSETNPAWPNKTFNSGNMGNAEQICRPRQPATPFITKVYDDRPSNVYNLGSKSTYHTTSFDGAKAAAGYNQAYATKGTPSDLNQTDSAFAPIGSSQQNRTAPIDAKTYATFAAPDSNKDFAGPEADALHRHAKPGERIDGDMQAERNSRPPADHRRSARPDQSRLQARYLSQPPTPAEQAA